MFVLKTDNFWFVPWQYNSASEHIHSMFAACLLTVHTSEHHVLGCHIRLCRRICSIVCTGLYILAYAFASFAWTRLNANMIMVFLLICFKFWLWLTVLLVFYGLLPTIFLLFCELRVQTYELTLRIALHARLHIWFIHVDKTEWKSDHGFLVNMFHVFALAYLTTGFLWPTLLFLHCFASHEHECVL